MVQSENTWKCQKKCFVFHYLRFRLHICIALFLTHFYLAFQRQSAIRWQHCCISNNNNNKIRARVCVCVFSPQIQCTKMLKMTVVFFLSKFTQFIDAILASINQKKSLFSVIKDDSISKSLKMNVYAVWFLHEVDCGTIDSFRIVKKSLANSWRDYSFMLYTYKHKHKHSQSLARTHTRTYPCVNQIH